MANSNHCAPHLAGLGLGVPDCGGIGRALPTPATGTVPRLVIGLMHSRTGTPGVAPAGPTHFAPAVLGLRTIPAGKRTLWNGECAPAGAHTNAFGYAAAFGMATMVRGWRGRIGERLLLRKEVSDSTSSAEPVAALCWWRLTADAVVTTELPLQPRMVLAVGTAHDSSRCVAMDSGGQHCRSPAFRGAGAGGSRIDLGVDGVDGSVTGSSSGRKTLTCSRGDIAPLAIAMSKGDDAGITGDDIILFGELSGSVVPPVLDAGWRARRGLGWSSSSESSFTVCKSQLNPDAVRLQLRLRLPGEILRDLRCGECECAFRGLWSLSEAVAAWISRTAFRSFIRCRALVKPSSSTTNEKSGSSASGRSETVSPSSASFEESSSSQSWVRRSKY